MSATRFLRAVLPAALCVPPLAACGSLVGSCVEESVRVEIPATVQAGGTPQTVELAGRVSEDNLDPAVFRRIRRVAADAGSEAGVFAWDLAPHGTAPAGLDFLALALRAPLAEGAALQVRGTFQGGGWGFLAGAPGVEAAAGARVAGQYASAVTGTVQVLDASPLRLRLDLQLTPASGAALRVQGDAAFDLLDDRVPCS